MTQPRLIPVMQKAAFVFVLAAVGAQLLVQAEKELRFKRLAIVEALSSAVSLGVALWTASLGWGVDALVAGLLTNAGMRSAGAWLLLARGWRPLLTLRLGEVKPHVRFGLYVVGGTILGTVNAQIDINLGGWFLGATAIGLYSLPRELSLRVLSLTNPIVTRVSFPLLAEVQRDRSQVRRVYFGAVSMIALVNVPIYAALALYAEDVILLALGADWSHAVPIFRILALRGMFAVLGNPSGGLVLAMGRGRLLWWWTLSQAFIMVVVISAASPWGGVGLAWAKLIISVLSLVLQHYVFIRPLCAGTFGDYSRAALTPAMASAAACAVAWSLTLPLGVGPLRLILGGLAGGIVYLLVTLRRDPRLLSQLWRLLGRGRQQV